MARQFTQEEIKAMPDAEFNEIWWGDFIEVNGQYKEIIGLTLNREADTWIVATSDRTIYEDPENHRFKKNPITDYSGSP